MSFAEKQRSNKLAFCPCFPAPVIIDKFQCGSISISPFLTVDKLILRADHRLDVQKDRSQVSDFLLRHVSNTLLLQAFNKSLNITIRDKIISQFCFLSGFPIPVPVSQCFQIMDRLPGDPLGHQVQLANVLIQQ